MTPNEILRQRAADLHLNGLIKHWDELADSPWVEPLLGWEEAERSRRSLERRLASAPEGPRPSPRSMVRASGPCRA